MTNKQNNQINCCDGCQRGLARELLGLEYWHSDGITIIDRCTKDRYSNSPLYKTSKKEVERISKAFTVEKEECHCWETEKPNYTAPILDTNGMCKHGVKVKKKEENKCEPSDFVLTSNPPQNKCKNCGKTWIVRKEIPTCSPSQSKIEERLNKLPEQDWFLRIDDRYDDFQETADCMEWVKQALTETAQEARREVFEKILEKLNPEKFIYSEPIDYVAEERIAFHKKGVESCNKIVVSVAKQYGIEITN